MPIKIQDNLPARKILNSENIFVMTEKRALKQDIRPLRIIILNLMPTKIETETQLMRLLANTPLQIEVELMTTESYVPKNTSHEHLSYFYHTFDYFHDKKYDGMIITGAPVEKMEFSDVSYYNELQQIMEWSKTHVTSTMHICWGAQVGLFYHYNVEKYPLPEKITGIFAHRVNKKNSKLLRGFDDVFYAPHSRYTGVKREDIVAHPKLDLLAESKQAGVYIVASKDRRQIFVTGHAEYDADTLALEYARDREKKGDAAPFPQNYFQDDDPSKKPVMRWRSHASLLFSNWLNYYVYQTTPFHIEKIKPIQP